MLYSGDIDTDGLKILSSVRADFSSTQSVLMDVPTLRRYRERWVEEPGCPPAAEKASTNGTSVASATPPVAVGKIAAHLVRGNT